MLGIVFDISFIVSGITKISCFNLTALVKFTVKMCYVWQGVVITISQQKCGKNVLHYVCHDTKSKQVSILGNLKSLKSSTLSAV